MKLKYYIYLKHDTSLLALNTFLTTTHCSNQQRVLQHIRVMLQMLNMIICTVPVQNCVMKNSLSNNVASELCLKTAPHTCHTQTQPAYWTHYDTFIKAYFHRPCADEIVPLLTFWAAKKISRPPRQTYSNCRNLEILQLSHQACLEVTNDRFRGKCQA